VLLKIRDSWDMTLSSGKWFLTFRKIDVTSSSEIVTIFQNIGNQSLDDMV